MMLLFKQGRSSRGRINVFLMLFLGAVLAGCERNDATGQWHSSGQVVNEETLSGMVITIGDIEPDSPTSRLAKLRPLANHLATELGWERRQVAVRIARSYQEISTLMKNGEVDLYIDSSYPVLLVAKAANAEVILDSPVSGQRVYQSLIIADASGPITDLSLLKGQILALQEPYSTSGYLLPAATIVGEGFSLSYLAGPSEAPPDEIGFFYSGDEENTLAMLRQGIIQAGAIASTDWDSLSPATRQSFRVLAKSHLVPRKLMAIRADIDDGLKQNIISVMLGITDKQREEMVANSGWSWKFLTLDEQSYQGIAAVNEMIRQTTHLTTQ